MVAPLSGMVLERDGSRYRVATAAGEVRAILRGRVKRDTPRIVVGDRVHLDPEPQGGLHAIVEVAPRRSLLGRRVPEGRGIRPVAANLDQVFVVTAAIDPVPIPQLIDRLLVVAEANELPAALIVNKTDLASAEPLAQCYRAAGYSVFPTSAVTGHGLEPLRQRLHDRITVVTGPSGAGKSSLLNAIEPGLQLRVGALSTRVRRGRQTTVSAVMIPLALGGYLVDTPGFSEVGLWGVPVRELAHCFPEFRARVDQCHYPDCSHRHEPRCAVLEAVASGAIAAARYDSYQALYGELAAAPQEWE